MLLMLCFINTINIAFSQNYWYYKTIGSTDAYSLFIATGSTNIIFDKPVNDKLSGANTIPFPYTFMDSVYTSYKVSDNGYLTFDKGATASPNKAMAIPSDTAPKNAIFALWSDMQCVANTKYTSERSQVFSYTYGSSPNRTHVVQWYGMGKTGFPFNETNIVFMAIKLYEAGGFDIVYGGKAGSISGLAGYQNYNGTKGLMIGGTESFDYPIASTALSILSEPNMIVYKFIPGNQPKFDVGLTKISVPVYVAKTRDVTLSGKIVNYGSENLTSLKINYSIDGAAAVTGKLAIQSVAASGGVQDISFPAPLNFNSLGAKNIKVWIDSPNGNKDLNGNNDTLNTSTETFNNVFPRKVLHEIFTSSTCPPCLPGNTNLASVLNPNKDDSWNVIKYQENFPGTGDPYYTAECGTRQTYYGATFAPWLTVDGSYNQNANSYTQDVFSSYNSKPSLVNISATHSVSGNTFTVSGTLSPVQAFTNTNLKLRIAIIEPLTLQNVKTNGETEFYNVMKKMLPNAAGTAISFAAGTSVPFTQTYTFPGTYRLPKDGLAANIINLTKEHSVEIFGTLQAIVFVQDDAKKEVWQSQSSAVVFPLSVKDINANNLFSVYPNPTENNFNVAFKTNTTGSIRIIDMSGKEMQNTTINSMNQIIDCSNLNNGLYIVQIEANGTVSSQKLNIAK